jgi:GNAT superfamily N-acetyltransferase
LEDASGLCGYVFGAPDSERFARRFADEWMPVIARQLEQMRSDHAEPRSQAEAELREWFKRPTWFFPEPGDLFPSHLHIDLLPRAQGRGYGGRMVNLLLDALGARGSAGVHLGMHPLNQRALRFYGRLGFQELALANETLYLGRRLSHGT